MTYETSTQPRSVSYAAEIPVVSPNVAACTGPPPMPLLTRHEQRYEKANEPSGASFGSALRSLKRYKAQPQYRLDLLNALSRAREKARAAQTPMETRRANLTALTCQLEFESLERGDQPDAFTGHVRFQRAIEG